MRVPDSSLVEIPRVDPEDILADLALPLDGCVQTGDAAETLATVLVLLPERDNLETHSPPHPHMLAKCVKPPILGNNI